MLYRRNILICDDSPMVLNAMSRAFSGLDSLTLHFAENGKEGLECLKNHDIDVLFLDLTMPVMDGFELLQRLPVRQYQTKVVVLSADVQKQAIERCISLGANHFLPKPFTPESIISILRKLGISLSESWITKDNHYLVLDHIQAFKEVSNVALGRGAAIISDHFGEFIKMPLANVASLSFGELTMAINDIRHRNDSVAIAQRFVGGGIHGEALVCLRGKDIAVFGERLGFSQMDEHKSEIVIDIANLMVSSFLGSLSEQMNISFSVRQPIVMEDYMLWGDFEDDNSELFTVEYTYHAESLDLECDVLFMMDNNSTLVIKKIMETLH